jgi:hypothetical protein
MQLARALICLRALIFLVARAAGSLARDLFASDSFFLAQGRGILERPHLTCQMCLREFNTPSKLTAHNLQQGRCRSPRPIKRQHAAPASDSGSSLASSRGEESPVRCISMADSAGEEEDQPDTQLQEQPQGACGAAAAGPAEEQPGESSLFSAFGFSGARFVIKSARFLLKRARLL